ncbi:MAG: hypothetical protein Q9188_003543 [Gyalolechia gomerana]
MVVTDNSTTSATEDRAEYKWITASIVNNDAQITKVQELKAKRIDAKLVLDRAEVFSDWCRHISCFFNIIFYQPSNWSTLCDHHRENMRDESVVLGKSAFFYEMGTASVWANVDPYFCGPLNLSEAIFKCLKRGLMDASNAWEELTKALEDFLGISSKSTIATETDLDLFEDANFSKSRSTRQEDIAKIKGGDLQQRRALHAPVTNLSASEDDANGGDLDERCFSMPSLWSINETYPRHTLVWLAVIIAVTTYVVTFNLNWLASSVTKLYQKLRTPVTKRMCDDSAEAWNIRGNGLTGFQPKREPRPFRMVS